MITVSNIHIAFDHHLLLNNAKIELCSSSLTALQGISGSGKTTLLNYLYEHLCQTKTKILFIRQNDHFFEDMRCIDNLKFQAQLYQQQPDQFEIETSLAMVGLKLDPDTYPKALSGGEKQRLLLALAWLCKPEILLLDELTASLDEAGKELTIQILKKMAQTYHMTIVIATHDPALAQQCDVRYLIENQQLLCQYFHPVQQQIYALTPTAKKPALARQYLRFREAKHFFEHSISSLVNGSIIACLTFGFIFFEQIHTETETVLSRIPENQTLMIHNIPPQNHYLEILPLFDQETENILFSFPDLTVYPFFSWSIDSEYNSPYGKMPVITFERQLDDQDPEIITIDNNIDSYFIPSFCPYYPEQHFEDLSLYTLPVKPDEQIPCYLSEGLAQALDITIDQTQYCQLTFTVCIPIDYQEDEIEVMNQEPTTQNESGILYPIMIPITQKHTITLQVAGIVASQTANYSQTQECYLPYDDMKAIMESYSSSTYLQDGHLQHANAYMLFHDHPSYLQTQLINQIPNIAFTSSRESHRALLSTIQQQYVSTIRSLLWGTLCVLVVTQCLTSLVQEKAFKKDRALLHARQCSLRQIRGLVGADFLREAIWNSLIAALLTPLVMICGLRLGFLMTFAGSYLLQTGIMLILLSCLLAALSHCISLLRG